MDGVKKALLDKCKRFKKLRDEKPRSVEERLDRLERLGGLKDA